MEKAIERLNQIAFGFMEAKILFAAAELGLFDLIEGPGTSAAAVAQSMGGSLRGTEILLDALVAMDLVVKQDGLYRNHPDFGPLLLENAPSHYVAGLRHRNRLFRCWAFLEETVRGQELPAALTRDQLLLHRQQTDNFIRAMYAVSHRDVGPIADAIDLAGVTTFCDLGGGPGHYLAEFARRRLDLEPYLVDLPLTLEVARKIQAGSEEGARIQFIAWDFYKDDPPPDFPRFDLVFLSQVIHAASPGGNRGLFKRLVPLINPGGRLVIHERTVDPDRTSPKEAAIFAVNMLAMTEGGRTYTVEEIERWLGEAGFIPAGHRKINERSTLITARR